MEKTRSGISFATNISMLILPIILLSPIFGALTDKYSKKKIIIISDFLNGALMILIYFLWDIGDNIFLIYIGSALSGIFSNLVSISFEAGKPEIFTKEKLTRVNSITVMITSLSNILGPILGGVIYSFFDLKFFILINGLSFFISMVFECFLFFTEDKSNLNNYKNENIYIKYIYNNKKVFEYLLYFLLVNFSVTMIFYVSVPYILNITFDISKSIFGMVQSFLPMGMILGAFITGKLNLKLNLSYIINVFLILILVNFILLYPLSFNTSTEIAYFYSIGLFILGIVGSSSDIIVFSYFQEILPENVRGKIIGLFISLIKFVVFITVLLSGKIIDIYSPNINLYLSLIVSIISLLLINLRKNNKLIKKIIKT